MIFSEMIDDVLYRLGESISSPKFWSRDDIGKFINEAYKNVAIYSNIIETSGTLSLIANRNTYTVEADHISILRMYYETSDQLIEPINFETLNKLDPYWETTTGSVPVFFGLIPQSTIFIYPRMTSSSSNSITYYYSKVPDDLTANNQPEFQKAFHGCLVDYAIATAMLRDPSSTNKNKSLAYYKLFLETREKINKRSNDRDARTVQIRKRFE